MKTKSFYATVEGDSLDLEEAAKYISSSVVSESDDQFS